MFRNVQFANKLAKHQKPAGLLLPLPIPEWKWDNIAINFVMGLSRTSRGYDSIWVIVDRLTKSAHFVPIKKTYPLIKFARIYIEEIVKLHSVSASIVSDRDPRYTSHFRGALHEALGSSADRWSIREDDQDSRGYVESLCSRFSR